MIVHPRNPDIAFAAVLGKAFGPSGERGVYRTVDGGKTWTAVLKMDADTGASDVAFDPSNPLEIGIRSPEYWLRWVTSPTFVIEGTEGNIESLRAMKQASTNAKIQFFELPGKHHFSVLAPATRVIAAKVLADDGPSVNIPLTEAELAGGGRK